MLDGYACQLWDECFHCIVPAGAQNAFRYDYHLLVRWLLKICFNSARMHDSDVRHPSWQHMDWRRRRHRLLCTGPNVSHAQSS